MRNLVAFPLLALAVILQSSVISQVKLLSGYADLILLVLAAWALQERVKSAWHWAAFGCIAVGFISSLPWYVYAIGYFSIVFVAQTLQGCQRRYRNGSRSLKRYIGWFQCEFILVITRIFGKRSRDYAEYLVSRIKLCDAAANRFNRPRNVNADFLVFGLEKPAPH